MKQNNLPKIFPPPHVRAGEELRLTGFDDPDHNGLFVVVQIDQSGVTIRRAGWLRRIRRAVLDLIRRIRRSDVATWSVTDRSKTV